MTAGPLHLGVRPGSEKARIWALCDRLYAERGVVPSGREVVDLYVAQGGNEGTGFTQYSHWKKALDLKAAPPAGLSEAAAPYSTELSSMALEVRPDGSLTLPPAALGPLGLAPGQRVSVRLEDGELRLSGYADVIRRIQQRMAKYKKPGVSVVDEFLAERRALWGEDE